MAEDSAAERQVAVGMFTLKFPSASCVVTSHSGQNSAFATWEIVTGLAAGEYGLLFRNGYVEGHAVQMVTINLNCLRGTHQIGVMTNSHADSNGLSLAPAMEYATSVGRGDAYASRATVLVKLSTEDVGVFAYPSDGRATLNNLMTIGQPAPTFSARLDSISNNPYTARSVNVACSPSSACTQTLAASVSGAVSISVGHGSATDSITINVNRPSTVTLSADDTTLSAIQCMSGVSTGTYQSTQLHLSVEGLDMTDLSSYSSSDPAVAEVVGSKVIGRGVGTAVISAYGGLASVSITVVSSAVSPHLVARVVTALNASSREQIFDSEDDVGYLYVYANYTNGDSHEVDASELSVVVEATDKLSYAVVGNQQKVSIVQDALAGSSCTEPLLRVSLSQCNASMLDAVYPPLNLQLPTPVGLQPLVLSQTDIAPPEALRVRERSAADLQSLEAC